MLSDSHETPQIQKTTSKYSGSCSTAAEMILRPRKLADSTSAIKLARNLALQTERQFVDVSTYITRISPGSCIRYVGQHGQIRNHKIRQTRSDSSRKSLHRRVLNEADNKQHVSTCLRPHQQPRKRCIRHSTLHEQY